MHPHAEHRQSKVERSRVAKLTRGYATGGAVHSDAAEDRAMVRKMIKPKSLKVEGGDVKARADRPGRKRGGRVGKGKATTVNVIVAGQGGQQQPPGVLPVPMPPPGPPPGAALPPGGPPMLPPGAGPGLPPGMGPGMPMRASGGRAYAKGGRVGVNKGSAVYEAGVKAGTQVSHSPGKNDLKDMGRGKPITYATGGAVEHPAKGAMAPHLPGGAGGGEARLAKAAMAKRKR